MKLADLKKKFADAMQIKDRKAEELGAIKQQLEEVSAAKLAAADRGDLETYKTLEEQERDLNARIFVGSRNINALEHPVSSDDVRSAWWDYAKEHDANIKREYKDFLKSCGELAETYKKIVAAQKKALEEREAVAAMIGEEPYTLEMFMLPAADTDRSISLNVRYFWNYPEIEWLYKMCFVGKREGYDLMNVLNGNTGGSIIAENIGAPAPNWTRKYI